MEFMSLNKIGENMNNETFGITFQYAICVKYKLVNFFLQN